MSSAINSERVPYIVAAYIGTLAATGTAAGPLFRKKTRIKAVTLTDQAGVVADNTNFLQVSVQTLAGTVVATFDTRAAHEGALTALTGAAMVISASTLLAGDNSGEIEIPAATQLKVVCTKNGTGVPTLANVQFEAYSL